MKNVIFLNIMIFVGASILVHFCRRWIQNQEKCLKVSAMIVYVCDVRLCSLPEGPLDS